MSISPWELYVAGLAVVMGLLALLWLVSIPIRNVSIVDVFWGFGFVVIGITYYALADGYSWRGMLVLLLSTLWGLRLSIHLGFRNLGKGEDYRYVEFRKRYGEHRYWWFSFFQVFLLQGVLLWLISSPLLAVHVYLQDTFTIADGLAMLFWAIGFVFEAGGDYQLMKFRRNPANKGKVLSTGFWKYTRHPNYFGDAAVWWGFALFGVAAGAWWPLLSATLMNLLLLKISGVSLLERTLSRSKPGYADYINRTSAFFPWFPKP